MGIEFELKYRATPQILAQISQSVTGTRQQYRMQTTYYDTPDRALSRQRCTLRCRMENDTAVCTLKIPAEDGCRAEFELECTDIRQAIPKLCKLSGFAQLEELTPRLLPICGARFDRTAITVVQSDCTLELALDTGVLTGGGKEEPLCELEVELKYGDRTGAQVYAQLLALAYGLTPEPKSKFRRAALLAEGDSHG